MSEAIPTYNPDLQPQAENVPHCDELRLLSGKQNNSSEQCNQLNLLSKRKAQTILKIGYITLNKLINEGEIKIILINGKERIPYISLVDFVNNKSIKKITELKKYIPIREEESVAQALAIINEINEGAQ